MNSRDCAVVFPGQGVQRPGMGRDFHQQFDCARAAYAEASEAIGLDLAALCFGEDARLSLTEYAQPAILVTEIAMFRAACELLQLDPAELVFGGHSLGEYTALVAAGALPLSDAACIVRERGRLMQVAAPVGTGGMTAVIGDDLEPGDILPLLDGLQVTVANDNARNQVVLTGLLADLDTAEQALTARRAALGIDRCVRLDVSAPFHSPFMEPAEAGYRAFLANKLDGLDTAHCIRVTSNFSGGFHACDRALVQEQLVRQISGTVQWRANMKTLAHIADRIVEVGPGRPLRGFFATLGIDVQAVTAVRALQRLAEKEGTPA